MTTVIGLGPPPWHTFHMSRSRPDVLASLPPHRLVHLDVREEIRQGKEPFPMIMEAVHGLRPDQVFVLRAPFEPLPLYNVLGKRGFVHWAESRADDDWTIWFWREGESRTGDGVRSTR